MPRDSDFLYNFVHNSRGTSTNRSGITPEMRQAYQQCLREKEQIIAEIHNVREELRVGGISLEKLIAEEKRLADLAAQKQPLPKAKKGPPINLQLHKNPEKVHPVAKSLADVKTLHQQQQQTQQPEPLRQIFQRLHSIHSSDSISSPAAPATIQNQNMHQLPTNPSISPNMPVETQNVHQKTIPEQPQPPTPPSAKPHRRSIHQYPPIKPKPAEKYDNPWKNAAIYPQTPLPTENVPHQKNQAMPESDHYKHKPMAKSALPKQENPYYKNNVGHAKQQPAKEIQVYEECSDTSLAIQRDLQADIAQMHAAIQRRFCLSGAFIVLLIFLLLFY